MLDMLVRLYDLPRLDDALASCAAGGITIRRLHSPEKPALLAWVREHFPRWLAEAEGACCRLPVACFVAVREGTLIGFVCYDATCRNFFGPEGVLESERGHGVGRALLLAALHAQREQGYAYAIVGGVGPADFYAKSAGATPIPGSTPGIYAGLLGSTPPALDHA
jgi:GNAT superfamily N-acetyltransferase